MVREKLRKTGKKDIELEKNRDIETFILSIVLIFVVCSSFNLQKKELLRKFEIGKFSYSMYKENKYLHDDNWNAEFFEVYRSGNMKRLCSSYLSAKRNDSIFVKGHYVFFDDKIEFTQCYYYNKNNPVWIDSIRVIFYPNKKGDLILKETIEFKNGEAKIVTNNKIPN
ncbi:MAG TPA: hypothetical protein VK772_17660 [Puia sp.]|nr:hypothetical protein [Puia sp.]